MSRMLSEKFKTRQDNAASLVHKLHQIQARLPVPGSRLYVGECIKNEADREQGEDEIMRPKFGGGSRPRPEPVHLEEQLTQVELCPSALVSVRVILT